MMNIQKMMQQAQEMQFKMQEAQEKFKEVIVEGQSGGGLVKVTMSCVGEVKSLDIDPSLLNADGKEEAEDLIIAAVNNAAEAKDQRIADETRRMMEAMGLPGDTQLPGV